MFEALTSLWAFWDYDLKVVNVLVASWSLISDSFSVLFVSSHRARHVIGTLKVEKVRTCYKRHTLPPLSNARFRIRSSEKHCNHLTLPTTSFWWWLIFWKAGKFPSVLFGSLFSFCLEFSKVSFITFSITSVCFNYQQYSHSQQRYQRTNDIPQLQLK